MELKSKINIKNLENFYVRHINKFKDYKRFIIERIFILFLCIALVLLVSRNSIINIGTSIGCLILLIFVKSFTKISFRCSFEMRCKKGFYSQLICDRVLKISDENLTSTSYIKTELIKYDTIASLYLIENYFIILLKNGEYILSDIRNNTMDNFKLFIASLEDKTNLKVSNSIDKSFL